MLLKTISKKCFSTSLELHHRIVRFQFIWKQKSHIQGVWGDTTYKLEGLVAAWRCWIYHLRVWAGGEQMMQIWAKRPQPNKRTSTTNCFHHLLHIYSLEVNIQNEIQQGSRSGHSAMIFVCSDKPWFVSPENMIFHQKLINQTLDQIKTFYKSSSFQGFQISILCTQFCIWMNSSEFRGRYWDETWANLSIYLRLHHCQPLDGNMRNHSLCQCNAMGWNIPKNAEGNLVFEMEQRPCAILFLTLSNGSERRILQECVTFCVLWRQTNQRKSRLQQIVLFRQKGKCRIIWYCPIAVKGEVCGNYWTVLDSSPTYSLSYWKSNPHDVTRKHDLTRKKTKDNIFSLLLKILMMTIDQVMIPCPYRFWSAIYYWSNFMYI